MPQRFLRPQITNSERWNSVSFSAQSLYVRLLTLVDDFGRYDGRSNVLLGQCYAVWNEKNPQHAVSLQQVEEWLQQLAAKCLIELYEVEGKRILQITQWRERVRAGVKERWPAKVAATCSNLLPSSPSPSPAPALAPSVTTTPFAECEIPSWEEWWTYCKSLNCGLAAEWYAKDKFQAAQQTNWKGKENWRAYANRCKTWWEQDGRPMAPTNRKSTSTTQSKPMTERERIAATL